MTSGPVTRTLHRHSFLVRWALSAGLLFVIMLMWSLASPVPSGPDEEAQLIKAAAVAHGTLIGQPVHNTRSGGTVLVKVPETISSARRRAGCDYDIEKSADCTTQVVPSSHQVTISTYEGRYPPLYYFITGLPTLFTSSASVLHLMRAMSALVVALLLGLAFAAVTTWGRSSMLLVGLTVTITPTVLYLGGVVNPSAMEIAGGVLLWAALAVMVFHRADDPPRGLVASAVVGAVALCASRPLSTGFFVLIVGSIALFRPRTCRALLRLRRVQIGAVVSLAGAFVSGMFVLFARSYKVEEFRLTPQTTFGYVSEVIGRGGRSLRQVIGSFGSPNFSVPEPVLGVWLVAGFGIIAVALLLARRRDALVLVGLVAFLGFILPFVIVYSHIKTDGVVWQGRYSLPLIAGFPIVSGLLIGERYPAALSALRRRIGFVVLPALCFGWVTAFYWVLRRYTVSLSSNATDAFAHDVNYWPPPVPAIAIFAVLTLATVAFATWIFFEGSLADRRRAGPHHPRVSNHAIRSSTSPPQPL
jgi:Predicted membrane protein (DUF2142)